MKPIRTISAVLLALLVLISSTHFIVGMHICMGEVQDVAFFSKADGCAMERQLPPCHRHAQTPCCDDETLVHEGTDLKTSFENISFVTPWAFIAESPMIALSEVIPYFEQHIDNTSFYDPPLPTVDRIVTLQVFLI